MDDYIKREAFLKTWCESYCRPKQNCRDDCSFYDAITQFPAADVRENVRGHWTNVQIYVTGSSMADCSICVVTVHDSFMGNAAPNFCPNCGADMCGGEKDD